MHENSIPEIIPQRNLVTWALAGIFILVFTGCANLSSNQTARVLEPGERMSVMGGGLSSFPHFYAYPDTFKKYGGPPMFPYFEFGGRTHVLQDLDVGARLTLFAGMGMDAKYQLYAGKSLALALGLGFHVTLVSKDDSTIAAHNRTNEEGEEEESDLEANVTDFILPFYASYDFSEWCTAYAHPKYVYRIFKDYPVRQSLVGASIGIKLGKDKGVFLEATPMRILGSGLTTTQWSMAYFRTFGAPKTEAADRSLHKGTIVEQDSASLAIELQGDSIIRIPNSNVQKIQSEVNQEEKGYHRHDGFFSSINFGGGAAIDTWKRSNSSESGTARIFGPTVEMDLKIGGAVVENLILSLDIRTSVMSYPHASGSGLNVNGVGVTGSRDTVSKEVSGGIGFGVTYYFMPQNIFLSGTLGLGALTIYHKYGTRSDTAYSSKGRYSIADGMSLQLKVGKEWWVSKNWGLGVSLAYRGYVGNEGKGDENDPSFPLDPSYKGSLASQRISLMFNTTFN